jgi:hypothetical protein
VYRQVFDVPQILHFDPSLDALRLQPDVITSIKILYHKMLGITKHLAPAARLLDERG